MIIKGKISPNKGRRFSEETKLKMSKGHKGKVTWNKGKKLSEEHKKNLSLSHKGQKTWLGKKHTEETKLKIKIAHLGKSSPHKGKINRYNNETLKKMSLSKIMAYKDKNSIFNSEEYKKRRIEASIKGLIKRPTSFEKIIINLCIKYKLHFVYTGDGRMLINFKNPDFVDYENKIVIEVFFSWFKIRDYGSVEEYKRICINKYETAGWKVVFLDENDIKDENVILNKIGGK